MNTFSKIGAVALLLLAGISAYGQQGPAREKIKTLKVAFITERLDLSSMEAQKFWPVYNEYEDQRMAVQRKERQQIRSRMLDFESLSEDETLEILNQLIALEDEKHQLNIALVKQMSTLISPRKTLLLIKAEDDFNKRLLRQIQQRNKGIRGQ